MPVMTKEMSQESFEKLTHDRGMEPNDYIGAVVGLQNEGKVYLLDDEIEHEQFKRILSFVHYHSRVNRDQNYENYIAHVIEITGFEKEIDRTCIEGDILTVFPKIES